MSSGFVNIIKPTGMTSSDVVIKIKKILGTKKVGHLGTLDPAASGVLPVAVGRGTKFFDYFLSKDKVYRALVHFGVETDTLDGTGKITNKDSKIIEKEQILAVLPEFCGEINQIPPKYSAVKVGGRKAYELARSGENFELEGKKIKVYEIKLISMVDENKFLFEAHVSAGTYIRTLFSDIAKSLGSISTTEAIIRTRSGRFCLGEAVTLEEFENSKNLILPEELFSDLKRVFVSGEVSKKLKNGVKIKLDELKTDLVDGEEFFVFDGDETIGFYRARGEAVEQIVLLCV